jgi:alpha-tubulin suppressor-like RCC1 family protein
MTVGKALGSILATFALVALAACGPDSSSTAEPATPIVYDGGGPAEGTSDADGRVVVESSAGDARYDLSLRAPSGRPAAGVTVTYEENARGRSEFLFTDPEGRFLPYLLTGTPQEIGELLGGTAESDLRPEELSSSAVFGAVLTLLERGLAFRKNQVAHQELRGFVETGEDLCEEEDAYCRCASLREIATLQRAAVESEGYWTDTGMTAVTWGVGQRLSSIDRVGDVVEVAGIGADAAAIMSEVTASAHATAIAEAAGTVPALEGLDVEEELLVRLLAFDGGGRKPTWRALQILNRGCEGDLAPNPGTLAVSYDPFPPDTGQDLFINVDVGGPPEDGLEVFLTMRSARGYPAFERWVSSTTGEDGRAVFKVPPHVLSSVPNLDDHLEVAVPERGLALTDGTISWDEASIQNPSPTIWSLTPDTNRAPVGHEIRFRYLVNQRTTIYDESFDLSCRLDFGDGTVRDDVPCNGTSTYRYIPWTHASHTYEDPGLYVARLTVTNGRGKSDTVHAPVAITDPLNQPPVLEAFAVADLDVGVGERVSIRWTARDPEGEGLSCTLGFGDGSESEIIDPCNGPLERFKAYASEGGYPVTLRVLDRAGGLAGEFAFVNVAAAASDGATHPLAIRVEGSGSVTSSPPGIDCGATCTAEFDHGTTVMLTHAPAEGWTFDGWTGDTDCIDGIVTVAAARACTATFVARDASSTVAFTALDGDTHALALDQDGGAWAWGSNDRGQLGDGSGGDQATPTSVAMPADTTFVAIAAGGNHSLALDQDGGAWAWGSNGYGQLGDGSGGDQATPVAVAMPEGTRFEVVRAGDYHSLALDAQGAAWAWGRNSSGQLGDGTGSSHTTPVRVNLPTGTRVVAIQAGWNHSLALDSAGDVWAWGRNSYGQLGDGTTVDRDAPVLVSVPSDTDVTSLAAGGNHSMALAVAGDAWAWGRNSYGQLGDGTTTSRTIPTEVVMPSGTSFERLGPGGNHSLALDPSGRAWAWGLNDHGQLGDGTSAARSAPGQVEIPSGTTFASVHFADYSSFALDPDGNAWSWGRNRYGQLGDGTALDRWTPGLVAMP